MSGYRKTTQRCRQFLVRGMEATRSDWRFHCAVATLAKAPKSGAVAAATSGLAGPVHLIGGRRRDPLRFTSPIRQTTHTSC